MGQHPITIVGAGIGGLTLARSLLKKGIPATIYDRNPSAPFHGYGITLHASTYRPLLKVLGLDERTFKQRTAVDGAVGGHGKINQQALVRPGKADADSFWAHRGRLEGLLREGLDVRWESGVEAVETTPSGVQLSFQNGSKIEAPSVIGVDGPHSKIRKSVSPDTELNVLPFVAINGKRRIPRQDFDTIYTPSMNDSTVLELKRGEVILHVSVNDITSEHASISWVYSRLSHGSSDTLFKPNRPTSSATDIPDEFFAEVQQMENLEQPFKHVFDVDQMKQDRVLTWLMRTVLLDLSELKDAGGKGVFFFGDAVHAQPILGGEGANVAIGDGIEMAECIAENGVEGVAKWYEGRYGEWESGVRGSERVIAEMHGEEGKSSL